MRDPFAARRSRTFVYADSCVIPRAQPVLQTDGTLLTTFDLREEYGLEPDEIDGITVTLRIPNRKGDQNRFAELTQTRTVLTDEGPSLRANVGSAGREAFLLIAESWTFPREISAEAFDDLEAWASEWIEACVGAAWQEGRGRAEEKKDSTSSSPKISPDSSDEADSPASPD